MKSPGGSAGTDSFFACDALLLARKEKRLASKVKRPMR